MIGSCSLDSSRRSFITQELMNEIVKLNQEIKDMKHCHIAELGDWERLHTNEVRELEFADGSGVRYRNDADIVLSPETIAESLETYCWIYY